MIELKQITETTVEFVFECLKELRGDLNYSLDEFQEYIWTNHVCGHSEFLILVGFDQHMPVGILTCNRFAMPRYLGFGYELEEVVVHEQFQGKGYGKGLVEAFLARVKDDKKTRKVLVKTDDQLKAGRLYEKFFNIVHTTVYSKTINYI